MKAAQIRRFGEPDVLEINDVDRPAAGTGEVLVSVGAASVNGHDVLVRAGKLTMMSGRRFPVGVGLDFAGTIAEAGPGVRGCQAGDQVWGTVHPRKRHVTGTAAEYLAVPADRVAMAPASLAAAEAAALVVAGTTALIALRDSAGLNSGERVLIRGAAGGVGTAAVQLARAMGGHATALAREQNAAALAAIALSSVHGSRRIRTFSANPRSAILDDLAGYVASGALHPVVSAVYPLSEIAAAQRAFTTGGGLGKQVITIP